MKILMWFELQHSENHNKQKIVQCTEHTKGKHYNNDLPSATVIYKALRMLPDKSHQQHAVAQFELNNVQTNWCRRREGGKQYEMLCKHTKTSACYVDLLASGRMLEQLRTHHLLFQSAGEASSSYSTWISTRYALFHLQIGSHYNLP